MTQIYGKSRSHAILST